MEGATPEGGIERLNTGRLDPDAYLPVGGLRVFGLDDVENFRLAVRRENHDPGHGVPLIFPVPCGLRRGVADLEMPRWPLRSR